MFYLLITIALVLGGCAPKNSPTPRFTTEIADFLSQLPPPLDPSQRHKAYTDLLAHRYKPWFLKEANLTQEKAQWGIRWLKRKNLYGENRRPLPPKRLKRWIEACRYEAINTLKAYAITTYPTSLRLFPTHRPIFFDPKKPGEGYPFDYNQNSSLPAATPLFVSHLSKKGGWAFVQAPFAFGWVPIRDIAFVTSRQKEWSMTHPLAIVTQEKSPIYDTHQRFLFAAKTSTLLPLTTKSDTDDSFFTLRILGACLGKTHWIEAKISTAHASRMPLPMTPHNVKMIATQLLKEPYGWGGMVGDRDCSAMTRDFFLPFGIYLPRNSRAQAQVGKRIDLSTFNAQEKERRIIEEGVPFRTLLYLPGHIMLYVGHRQGHAYVMHNLWGIHTKNGGRYIIGQGVVTTLHLGENLPDIAPKSLLIHKVVSMNILTP